MVTSLYYTYSTIPLWNILSVQSSSLGKHKVRTSAEVILCLWPCIGSPLKIGTRYQWGTQKSQACVWWMFFFFPSFSTPTEQTKTSLLRILSHSVQSREESPDERTSPEKKSFSLRKSVKCTTVFKGRLTQQEALGGVADNIFLDMFGTNSSK